MPQAKYSNEAIADLSSIAEYTIKNWGLTQSRKYRDGLKNVTQSILENPNLGSDASELKSGLRRFPFQAHTIFYLPTEYGILVVRILPQKMDVTQQL